MPRAVWIWIVTVVFVVGGLALFFMGRRRMHPVTGLAIASAPLV